MGGALYKSKELFSPIVNECAALKDPNLDKIMIKVSNGVDKVHEKHPGMKSVKISSGLRGIRYFLEFPIVGQNVDAYSLY